MWSSSPTRSATVFARGQSFPPSERKSLYGSISKRPVFALLYPTASMYPIVVPGPWSHLRSRSEQVRAVRP